MTKAIYHKPIAFSAMLILITFGNIISFGEEVSDKFKDSRLFPEEAASRLEIIRHPVKLLPGACLSAPRTPNGAYMWVKEISQGTRVVVVYIDVGNERLRKVDEFTFRDDDIPVLSRPVEVEVEGRNISYFAGSSPMEPKRLLFVRQIR